ncbi:betaine--homocysteine S-methyltransferase 1-like [Branchiostoma lanceolatum]|uniref:betaine--homocysteine S-methyltransferase 1-like n=1 Tax=Branchiostoma lanceolatum TaxID=7740 RepID=UPI00113311CF
MATRPKGLLDRLKAGETVICAEGYLFEFERRGYLKAGPFAPEVVVEHPELVRGLHREFAHAGSDVVLAFTYYGHRETLRAVGREDELETFNRTALKLAREVADETGTLMAGNICNTNCYKPDDPQALDKCRQIFKEQTEWAVAEGADFMVAETFHVLGEALLALECIKQYGNGLPAVVSFSVSREGLWCGHTVEEAMLALEEAGAAVVGLNCGRGPATMLPLMEKVVNKVKVPFAALPVVYRTNEQQPTMHSLISHKGSKAFIVDMDEFLCGRSMVANFGQRCKELGVQYVGLCCGNAPHFTRTLAETMGRTPPASKYSPDMTKHFTYGTDRWYGNKSL